MTQPPSSPAQPPWPPLAAVQLARAARSLAVAAAASTTTDAAFRAQLEALASAVDCLDAQSRGAEPGAAAGDGELESELEAALLAGDEAAVIAAARQLAARHRALAPAVDWSAVSGG